MIWESWSDFFAMGGYALYVWGSLLALCACMLGEVSTVLLRAKSIRKQLTRIAGTGGRS